MPVEPTDSPGSGGAESATDETSPRTSSAGTSGTAADTGSTTGSANLTLAIEGAWDGLGVAVVPFRDPLTKRYDWVFRAPIATGPVTSATPTLRLPTPTDAELSPMPQVSGVRWGTHMVTLFEDADGDAAVHPTERWAAVARHLLVYIDARGAVPGSLSSAGIVEGWNAVDVFESLDATAPIDAFPITVHPLEETLALSGGATPSDVDNERLALVPDVTYVYGESTETTLYDELLTDVWSIRLKGVPPADHLSSGSKYVPDGFAVEYPVVYFDVDDDQRFSAKDTASGDEMCLGTSRVVPAWVSRSSDLGFTWQFEGRTGWLAVLLNYEAYGLDFATGEVEGLQMQDFCK